MARISSQTVGLVSHEQVHRAALEPLLRPGSSLLQASSGAEALQVFGRQDLDALFIAEPLLDMSGAACVSALKQGGVDAPAVLLMSSTGGSNRGWSSGSEGALDEGARGAEIIGVVAAPFLASHLAGLLEAALEVARLRRALGDRQRRERRERDLLVAVELTDPLAVPDPGQLGIDPRALAAMLEKLRLLAPFDEALLLLPDGSGGPTTLVQAARLAGEERLVALRLAALQRARACGLGIDDARLDVHVTPPVSQGALEGAPAYELTIDLCARGRLLGQLWLSRWTGAAFSPEERALLQSVSARLACIQDLRGVVATNVGAASRRLVRALEAFPDGLVLADDRDEVFLNEAARALLHLDRTAGPLSRSDLQEKLGFYPFELVRGLSGEASAVREELRLFDRQVQSSVVPVSDDSGAVHGAIVALRDVTDERRLEARKEEFLSLISHELRTPLTSIFGALDLTLSELTGPLNDKQRRYLAMARESTEKLNAIVDDLLDLSKLEQGKMRMHPRPMNLIELVASAVERYTPPALDKRISLSLAAEGDHIPVVVDGDRLGQVLNNLLTNAIKFTPEGGAVRLTLKLSSAMPGFAVLSCFNNGEPIAEDNLERIFDRYEQSRTERTRAIRGTGLGLAICQSIVEAHLGKIWAEPCLEGARFIVVLPLGEAPTLKDQLQRPPRGRNVLVVEDDADVAYVLKATLMSRGFKVVRAATAEQAIEAARRARPDVITLDLGLPDHDGLAVAQILQHDPETRHAPIVVLSARDDRERAFREGASAFLRKPIEVDALIATIDALLRASADRERARLLMVDADESLRSICAEVLTSAGFEVCCAGTLAGARARLHERPLDVILLDPDLPDGDGVSFVDEMKRARALEHVSVVFTSARRDTQAKVRALKLGGDDYLVKPFDTLELAARLEALSRRKEAELSASPTTQLPGSNAIERVVERRLSDGAPFVFCYLDLDNLKAFNDCYGYAKADGVIKQTGDLLREVIRRVGTPGDFLGHIAGDDFVLITEPARVDALCRGAIDAFDRIIPLYYEEPDRARGFIEAEDRFGVRRAFPVMSISIAAVLWDGAMGHAELARAAAELKRRAKAISGSAYLRSDRDPGARSLTG